MQESTPPPSHPVQPLFTKRALVAYALLVALAFGLFLAGVVLYRRGIDGFQRSHAITPIQRVDLALEAGDTPRVNEAVGELLTDKPLYTDAFGKPASKIWEGPLLRNQVTPLEELTARLMNAGLHAEAERVLWQSMLEFHVVSRTLELITSWELMAQLKAAQGEWGQAAEAIRILGAHGALRVRLPGEMEPPYTVAAEHLTPLEPAFPIDLMRALKTYHESTTPDELARPGRDMLNAIGGVAGSAQRNAAVRRQLMPLVQRVLNAGGQRDQAHALFEQASRGGGLDRASAEAFWASAPQLNARVNLLKRDPFLLDMFWQDRPSTSTAPLSTYLQTFITDPRVRTLDFSALEKLDLGFFNRSNNFYFTPKGLLMSQSVAGRMEIHSDKPIHKAYISFEAEPALGIYPILLVRFRDEDPFIPLYCDANQNGLVSIELNLAPGSYQFTAVYLNDSGFVWRKSETIREDRQLMLHRLLLVQVPPAE